MKSLLSNSSKDSIKEKLNYFEPFVSAAKKAAELEENSFLNITGIKGCLNSYFIREYFIPFYLLLFIYMICLLWK